MPPPHPDSVGSWGDHAAEWIETRSGLRLRWWQWMVLQRGLEYDAAGKAVWPIVLVSVSRQVGKSRLATELAAWRASNSHLFDQPQQVLHVARTLDLAHDQQSEYWLWGKEQGFDVQRRYGAAQIQWPDGSMWLVTSIGSVFGRRGSMILVDECWDMKPEQFWSGMWPTSASFPSAQAWLFSAANAGERGLVSGIRNNEKPGRLVMEWGAHEDDDPREEDTWRRCSPWMDEGRFDSMAQAAGEPAFNAEWLNVWPSPRRAGFGRAVAERLRDPAEELSGVLSVGALETTPGGELWGAATSDGVAVDTSRHPTRRDAWAWLLARTPDVVFAHSTTVAQLGRHPAVKLVTVHNADARAATALLRDVAGELVWRGPLLSELTDAEVNEAGDQGPILSQKKSTGPIPTVKAAAWAVWAARARAAVPAQIF